MMTDYQPSPTELNTNQPAMLTSCDSPPNSDQNQSEHSSDDGAERYSDESEFCGNQLHYYQKIGLWPWAPWSGASPPEYLDEGVGTQEGSGEGSGDSGVDIQAKEQEMVSCLHLITTGFS
jgi:hypothetical protein